ncbi:hypothetical protein [Clostridium senegalense]|uniref:hypothetical protein n=1 Tax=Clostridium senegalense TaxID=1465809 RepID=UPI001C101168|nr:hypothetical protein [Clostridium senegalense]MBU5225189.1 hypothetical protein [Clostridium senegalense]
MKRVSITIISILICLIGYSNCYGNPTDVKNVFDLKYDNKKLYEEKYLNNEIVVYGKIYKITEKDDEIAIFIKEHNSPLENTPTIDLDKRAKCIMKSSDIEKICDLKVWTEVSIKGVLTECGVRTLKLDNCTIYENIESN